MKILPIKNIWIRWQMGLGVFLLTLLCGVMITALIPKSYSATSIIKFTPTKTASNIQNITSDQEAMASLRAHTKKTLRAHEFLDGVIDHYNLTNRKELNTNGLPGSRNHVAGNISKGLTLDIHSDYTAYITMSSSSPHLARGIATQLARRYTKTKMDGFQKTVLFEPALPQHVSTPNIKYAALLSGIAGIILWVTACLLAPIGRRHT